MFSLTRNTKKYLKSNAQYFIVAAVLVTTFLYGQFTLETDTVVKRKRVVQQSDSFELEEDISASPQREKPSLDSDNHEKVYENILNSEIGDFYRIGIFVKAEKNERLFIKTRSTFSEEKEIGAWEVGGGVEKYYELIFQTDDKYTDIAISKGQKTFEAELDEKGIFLSGLTLTLLDIKHESDIKNLHQTIVGEAATLETYVPLNYDANFGARLSKKRSKIGQPFKAEGNYLEFVEINFDIVGTGGDGKYRFKLEEYSEEGGKTKITTKKEVFFTANKRKLFIQENGNYQIQIGVPIKKGSVYFISIYNKNVDVDSRNYISLNNISSNAVSFDSFFFLSQKELAVDKKGNELLSGSRIEDAGQNLIYTYKKEGTNNMLDIYDSEGKIEYVRDKGVIFVDAMPSNFYIYKVNTVYPFIKMRVQAKQEGIVKDQIRIEYSYDNSNWHPLEYSQNENESQLFNYLIEDNNKLQSLVYIRISYVSGGNNSGETFGLSSFGITALLIDKT